MGRRVRLAELALGMEGAALFRHVLDGGDDFVERRVRALRRVLDEMGTGPLAAAADIPELDVDAGYAAWASTYDTVENALIRAEEPLIEAALVKIAPGQALDAACGTGRQTARLVAHGHTTVGIDRSPAMLAIAIEKVPQAQFRVGRLEELPLPSSSIDVAVCSLALTHLADPGPAIAELARVVRPGGSVIVSDAHPTFVLIQGQALFGHDEGLAFVRNRPHLPSTYLQAFTDVGLACRGCAEAPMTLDVSKGLLAVAPEAAEALWRDIPAALVWVAERQA